MERRPKRMETVLLRVFLVFLFVFVLVLPLGTVDPGRR
jgi:hypothetical protein